MKNKLKTSSPNHYNPSNLSNKPTHRQAEVDRAKDSDFKTQGKLLDRFRIKVSDQEFIIEIFNQDVSDENLKKYSILVNGIPYTVEVEALSADENERKVDTIDVPSPAGSTSGAPEGNILTAPMPGKILKIKTKVGDRVDSGQPLVILEAMKMENVMTAPASGVVKKIPIQVGSNVNQGDTLVVIE